MGSLNVIFGYIYRYPFRHYCTLFLDRIKFNCFKTCCAYKWHRKILKSILELFKLLVKKVMGLLYIYLILWSYNILIWFFSCYSRDSPPTMGNKSELHYINAVISESMRKSSVVSSGVPHFVDEDTWVGNGGGGSGHYFFPKGSNVMANLTFIHYNPGWFKTQTNHH